MFQAQFVRTNITCPNSVAGSLMFKFGGSQTFTIGCYSYKIVLVTVNMNVHFILQEYVSPIHVRTQDRVFPVTRTVLNVTVLKGLLVCCVSP